MSESQDAYVPMDENQRANIQRIVDTLEQIGTKIGDWSDKADCRRTGVSLYLKFENEVDVMTTMQFVNTLQQAPALLADACRKLLAADASASLVRITTQ